MKLQENERQKNLVLRIFAILTFLIKWMFQNGCNNVVVEQSGVQFWSEIITMISDQIALRAIQLPL